MATASPTSQEFSPLTYEQYFDHSEVVDILGSGFQVYSSNFVTNENIDEIFFFIHGAAFSALSFALCSKELVELSEGKSAVIAADLRGHGHSSSNNDTDISIDVLTSDLDSILKHLYQDRSLGPHRMFLVGHSLGGSVATHLCNTITHDPDSKINVCGLALIDCIEETALRSLENADLALRSMPPRFESPNHAIAYMHCTNQIKNIESCRVSVPPRIVRETPQGQWVWRTDLLASKKHWNNWFLGFTDIFLAQTCPKLLCVSNASLLDTPMTIAQMQGKFEFRCLPHCGHHIHEDDPREVARMLLLFSTHMGR
mmetsp:Transcript_21426/g.25331  ORF Transcript_21426/g.25331 Transcript_21426/m.25331 type:complete len:313 (+) Transcript_21426:107-1045(+)|eukprot:CAMPEP_0114387026 /NCGR_PEP_ID=MMETSP0102-20121206/6999_1 /TAXON_ID=38822 ORGANISM="Pteridomonas danica, Strain PT" /NCGR_SAMPLE_ID=MMETSP0102 /ASSEMBLY_ACC=CAM_ASM_000212 /LENGTH=312 /DNA_ID=CAMNT_0001544019 /DNA_START=511 /DNA_END=1449 /DNA_ORIENTATION=-